MKTSGSEDFEAAFQRMKSAVRLCMGLIEAAQGTENENDLWAGVDAIVENASRDVKNIWKRRYTRVRLNGNSVKRTLRSLATERS
jgi:hypothetical protein